MLFPSAGRSTASAASTVDRASSRDHMTPGDNCHDEVSKCKLSNTISI